MLIVLIMAISCKKKEKSYYDNGNLKFEVDKKNGKLHGKLKVYSRSGMLMKSISYNEGVLEGEAVFYYENGNINTIDYYKDNLLNGRSLRYSENGNLIEVVTYVTGKKNGLNTIYKPSHEEVLFFSSDTLAYKIYVDSLGKSKIEYCRIVFSPANDYYPKDSVVHLTISCLENPEIWYDSVWIYCRNMTKTTTILDSLVYKPPPYKIEIKTHDSGEYYVSVFISDKKRGNYLGIGDPLYFSVR